MRGPMDLRDDDEYDRWSIAAWVVVMCLSGAAGIVAAAMWWGAR